MTPPSRKQSKSALALHQLEALIFVRVASGRETAARWVLKPMAARGEMQATTSQVSYSPAIHVSSAALHCRIAVEMHIMLSQHLIGATGISLISAPLRILVKYWTLKESILPRWCRRGVWTKD